jgi:hypothetical protein
MNGIWVRALPGSMHPGLTTGPLCPIFYTKLKEPSSFSKVPDGSYTQENPVPLLKFQMAPRLKIFMASMSKKGTKIYYSFLSKVPANKPPPGSPTGPLWKERPVYRAFCISLKNLIFRVPQ